MVRTSLHSERTAGDGEPTPPTIAPSGDRTAPRIRLLGRPTAEASGAAIPLPEKAFVLVALLACAIGNELDRDTVRGLLWEELPDRRRAGNLRQLLLRIGRAVAPFAPLVVASSGGLRLETDAWRVDLVELLATDSDRMPEDGRADTLTAGGLMEGAASGGEAFEDWLGDLRRKVSKRQALFLAQALHRPGLEPAERMRYAERLVALDPTDEAGYRALMAACAQAGDRQGAARWWLLCRKHLGEDLGIAPAEETRSLAVRLGLAQAASVASPGGVATSDDPAGTPTVVIMPPATLPGNELLDRLGLVLLEEVTLGLSQFGSFRVIAAHTSWQMSRPDADPSRGLAPRCDYAVTVGVRNLGDPHEPLGANCRLTRLSTGEVLWTVEREMRIADLQGSLNEIVRRTVASLAAAVERAEGRSAAAPDSTGYRLYLEGKRSVGATGLESLRAARKWFRAAVKRCDEFSAAFAGLSRTLSMEWLVRGMTDRELLDDALAAARQAQACDPESGRALREIGFANLYLRRHEDSLAHFSEARAFAPHDADLLADYADALMHDGQPDKALGLMTSAKELNPLGPDYYRWIEASIRFRMEDYLGAIRVLGPLADGPATARLMAASYAMAGDAPTARRYAAQVRENYPDFRVDQMWQILPDRRPVDTQQLVRGLQLAGLD